MRLLIERDGPHAVLEEATVSSKKRRRRGEAGWSADVGDGSDARAGGSGASRASKKRKLGDRVEVNPDMLKMAVKCNARDIAEYLAKEKGCVPDMQTLLMMSR